MPIGPVGGATPVSITNANASGASFRKEIPGASKRELFELIKKRLEELGANGEAAISFDETSGTVTATRSKFPAFKLRLIAEEGALEAKVDKYPPVKADLLSKKIVDILERAPKKVEDARAAGWRPSSGS